jgi:hypothetical protein
MSKFNMVANENVERLSMRELLVRARERLGSAAAALKTRQELEAALRTGEVPAPLPAPIVAPAERPEIVVRDFFVKR